MGATNELAKVNEVSPALGVKVLQVWTDDADENDFAEFTLADYGLKTVYNVLCQVHTTDNSVIVTEVATTEVDDGELKVTFPGSNDGKKRSILVFGQ